MNSVITLKICYLYGLVDRLVIFILMNSFFFVFSNDDVDDNNSFSFILIQWIYLNYD